MSKRGIGAVVRDYVDISKPRIILLLLIVAWAAMFVAARGFPDLGAFAAVTVAGILSTAASGALNNVWERKKDGRMGRTADRPVAAGRITPMAATTYAVILGALAWASLWVTGYPLAAWLTLGAVGFYFVVYTIILKPTTPHNIVLGGFAGSFPALIGWAAATGGLAWPAWILAALVFFWTPPHFWSLALLYKEDYAAAEFPMMPVIKGERSTKVQILAYAILTLGVSLALAAFGAGYLYLAAAAVLGGQLVLRCARMLGDVPKPTIRATFLFTIQYLGVLLLVLMVDQLVVGQLPAMAPFPGIQG